MGVPGNANALLLRSAAAAGGYQISRSLRFNSSDSAYLSRTPASAGNRKTWTLSFWKKFSKFSGTSDKSFAAFDGTNIHYLEFPSNNLEFATYNGSHVFRLTTSQVFRDPSAWYHILIAFDTTQATASNRVRIYVNGNEVTAFSTAAYPSLNYDGVINSNQIHTLGAAPPGTYVGYMDGYLAEVFFIEGQQLTPSSFTEVSATTGQLIPKQYTGSFGTNGFWLKFSDNSAATATTLGKDYSGNSNNWSPTNLSVTAGAGNDSLVDTPTSYGTDTGAGGEVRGNYATLNPLQNGIAITLSNGNLDFSAVSSGSQRAWGTIGVNTGKWYFECTQTSGTYAQAIGIKSSFAQDNNNNYLYAGFDGNKINASGSNSAYGATWANNDVVGVAFDLDAGTITFYKNGASQGQAFSGIASGTYFPFLLGWSGGTFAGNVNFGQRAFAYTAPSGFKALCDTNLPAPVVAKPSTVFNAITYTGTGANATIPNVNTVPTSIDFTPDLVWIKGRSGATDHALYDSVRDVQKDLVSNSTAAETTQSTGLTAFGTNNFNIGTLAKLNTSSSTYVGWCWDAGTTTASNPDGSITSSVRANASAGFSVATFNTGSSGVKTVGHGLNVAPSFFVIKSRSISGQWAIYHASLGYTQYMLLHSTSAAITDSGQWVASPTSSVFSFNSGYSTGANVDYVGYFWAPVAGYSSFGSYTGNGSADGPFVYTGFRPRFLLIKYSSGVNSWMMQDSARDTYNPCPLNLTANGSGAENDYKSSLPNDMLSNGFKLRNTNDAWNGSGGTYIYAAFAESPFQFSRAR